MDLRPRLTMPIAELARKIGARSYPTLHQIISGKRGLSNNLAKAIAASGAIGPDEHGHPFEWTEFFEDADHRPSPLGKAV